MVEVHSLLMSGIQSDSGNKVILMLMMLSHPPSATKAMEWRPAWMNVLPANSRLSPTQIAVSIETEMAGLLPWQKAAKSPPPGRLGLSLNL